MQRASKLSNKTKLTFLIIGIILLSVWIVMQSQNHERDSRSSWGAESIDKLDPSKLDAAIQSLSYTLRMHPDNPVARLSLAIAYEKKGWTEEAVKQYEQAIESSSHTLAQSFERLGQVLQGLNRHDEAARALEKATRIKSQSF